jgi:hypothetical protein
MTQAILLALALAAQTEASMENGKALFSSPDLGVNGKTCVQCHSGGKDFDREEVFVASSKDLGILINHCLSLRMKSAKLAPDSVELKSLTYYVKTYGKK